MEDHKFNTRKEDTCINEIVNLYLNNQDNQALRLTDLYLELGYILDIDKLERKIKEGIQLLIKINRQYKERKEFYNE